MKKTSLLAFIALTSAALAQQPVQHHISMVFTDTDASLALMAISMRTGANIIYANKTKTPITLKLSVNTTEEAVRSVSSSAGLVYRRVSNVFIVAASSGMKDALAPYAHTTTYAVEPGTADMIVQRLTTALPYVIAQASGDRVTISAINEDVLEAVSIIRSIRAPNAPKIVREIVMMHQMPAEEAVPLIKGFYPTLTVTSTESSKSAGPTVTQLNGATPNRWLPIPHGAIGLIGPADIVEEAKRTLEQLDSPSEQTARDNVVYDVYNLKYANGPSVEAFLKKVAPEIDVFVGPEALSPARASFNPLTGSTLSGGGSSGGGSAGGGGGGGAGGASGGSGAGAGITTTITSGSHIGDRSKSIVLKGRKSDVENAKRLVAELDVRPQQCIIEINVLETTPTDAEQIGLGYSFAPINFFSVPIGTPLGNNASGNTSITGPTTRPVGRGEVSMSPLNFQAILSAMVSHQKAKILAKPSLQVTDNDQGSVFIGNTLRVQLNAASGLGAVSQSIAEFPVGIIMLVSPKIGPDGRITLHVNPVISSVSSVDANGIPQTASREAETTVIVKDGETIVLGGLIQDQESKTVSEVPYLSKIPFIGQLFKTHNYSRTKTDIVVSITTHIVKEAKEGS